MIVVPSIENYQRFLLRIKHIINNSNYGANVKAIKLYPILKEWRFCHKNIDTSSSRYSLYFIKKRMLKIFCKESKQDFYSSKRLVEKCFFFLSNFSSFIVTDSLFFNNHLFFDFQKLKKWGFNKYSCVHCGMNRIL